MILPPPACFITGWTAFEHRNALVRLVFITLSHSSSSSTSGALRILVPALLTRMSIRPSSRLARSIMAPTAFLSVTSAAIDIALPPSCLISATAASDFAALRPTMVMAAPAFASPRAMPSPMPPLPPVTIATLPVRSNNGFVMMLPDSLRESRRSGYSRSAPRAPDQDQPEDREHRTEIGPFGLADHEAGCLPIDRAGALADPEQADQEDEDAEDERCGFHDRTMQGEAAV